MPTPLAIPTVSIAALLASCAQVIMVGPQPKAISREDVREIKRVVWQDRSVRSTALFIQPLSADRVALQSGSARVENDFAEYHTFRMFKRAGQWHIDEASVRHPFIVVTY